MTMSSKDKKVNQLMVSTRCLLFILSSLSLEQATNAEQTLTPTCRTPKGRLCDCRFAVSAEPPNSADLGSSSWAVVDLSGERSHVGVCHQLYFFSFLAAAPCGGGCAGITCSPSGHGKRTW